MQRQERPVNQSALEILDLEVGEQTGGMYHIKQGERGGYMVIEYGTFDEDTMCTPAQLIPQLPQLPGDCWHSIKISRSENGQLRVQRSYEALASVDFLWHDNLVDYFSLKPIRKISPRAMEVAYLGRVAIAKIARFPWEIPQISNETTTYCMISDMQGEAGIDSIIPTFLGHLHENGRVMGLLLEKVSGRCSQLEDLEACTSALRQLHLLGVEHGDVNRNNFIVNDQTRKVHLIDFEHATNLKQDTEQRECAALAQELGEETGRGAGFQLVR